MPRRGYQQSDEHIQARIENTERNRRARWAEELEALERQEETTRRLHAERRARRGVRLVNRLAAQDVPPEEAENARRELVRILRESDGYSTGNTDYSGSSMVARAAKAQAQADRFQGDPALPPPHIAGAIPRKQVQHEPVRTTHTHLHPSFGTVDGEDGLHIHEHDHSGDSLHAHDHEYGGDELRPGKESGPGMTGGG